MDYPVQVWYGVYFSGEDADTPPLPGEVHELVYAGEYVHLAALLHHKGYRGTELQWVFCGGCYGLAVAESLQTTWGGELTKYPVDIADTWSAQLASALAALGIDAARITWYASAAL